MAEKNKNEKKDEQKFELDVPPASQVDLERRQSEDYKSDFDVSGRVVVNPNPFGEEEYVGTDPIYQNYAEETHKPYAAESGPEQVAEKELKDAHKLDDSDDVVDDFGLGGKARRADQVGVSLSREDNKKDEEKDEEKDEPAKPATPVPPTPTK